MICIASHSAYPVPPLSHMVVFRLQKRRGLVWHVIKKFRTKVHVQCTVDHVDGGQKKRGHSQGGCRHPGSRRPRPTFPVQAPRLATISPWSDKMLVLPYSIKDMVSLIMGFMSTKPLFAVKNKGNSWLRDTVHLISPYGFFHERKGMIYEIKLR